MRAKLSILLALAVAFAMMPMASADPGTLEEDIETSVVAGLAWLEAQQNPDGSFGGECDSIGVTGLAVLKFEDRAIDLGLDPLGAEYDYSYVVQAGLDYIMLHMQTTPIGVQPAGDPDGDGDGIGVFWDAICYPGHVIYNTGIAMMALSASGHPELYGDTVQDAVDFMSFAQEDVACGVHRGGWRYEPNECSSDNSTSGYATLGLGFAEAAPPYGFGITAPQFVKDELSMWIDMIQDPVDGDVNDGGSHYTPGGGWVNTLKTGNLLYEMGLVGDGAGTPRVLDAIDYLARHWNDIDSCGAGWLNHRQAMFTMMKGLEGLGIEVLDLDGVNPLDEWFPLVAQHLIATQNPDGSWPLDCWGDTITSTAWALLTLEKAVPTFEIAVPVDIKPWSCRNPLNVKKRGVIPVAILGTEDFDVTQVDPASVQLVGVSPLRWNWHDVGTPYVPYLGKEHAYDCIAAGPDGYLDLIFKFQAQEVIAALGDVEHRDVLVLPLTGMLKEEFGGTPIIGEDVIVIIKR
jgi:hypothetical protein